MATNNRSTCASSQVFLTEDIMKIILLRLPTGSSIARFRCVCRSWRILLSDPQFILKILFFSPNNSQYNDLNNSSLQQILITSGVDRAAGAPGYRYSLLSYDTLSSASAAAGDLPCLEPNTSLTGWRPRCHSLESGDLTKLLPVSAYPPRRSLFDHQQITGFGFDPETNDYKIARILFFAGEWDDFDDYDLTPDERRSTVTIAEVYSLKNHSWKRLTVPDGLVATLTDRANSIDPHDQWGNGDDSHRKQSKRHCYWFYACFAHCFTLSFDMVEEVFEYTDITLPPVLRNDTFMASRGSFMLKDSVILAVFRDGDDNYSMWCMLKHGVVDSWIQLYAFRPPVFSMELETWKEDRYICSRESRGCHPASDPKEAKETDGVWGFSPSTGKYGDRIEIQGRKSPFQVYRFTQTQISLSGK
ncbi:unnamed protein product [Linum tenue]|uniref:F-box domain-containing protein n=1 Tax=Linum tenue TaxID=586396 RepID=A0AAV0IAH6_9ROSI|nr:unnamed protein product [Linum tenue]